MVGTTTGSSGRPPALTSPMEIMLGASAALSGRVAARCAGPASGIKGRRLDCDVESGPEGAVALVDRADVLNPEALDPDQIAWASSANAAATRLAGGVSIRNSNGQRISPGTIEPELQTSARYIPVVVGTVPTN
jgi:hypothetical protein